MLSGFHCWVWCYLWVCHIWPLYGELCSLYTYFLEYFKIINECWILSKAFFCIYGDVHMLLKTQFFNVIYHIDWFVDIEKSSYSWSEFPLIMMCREPARESPPMTRSCRTRGTPWAIRPMTRSCRRVLISKASGLDGPPGSAWASIPKPESVCLIILCLSPALLTLAGGCPQPKEFT